MKIKLEVTLDVSQANWAKARDVPRLDVPNDVVRWMRGQMHGSNMAVHENAIRDADVYVDTVTI